MHFLSDIAAGQARGIALAFLHGGVGDDIPRLDCGDITGATLASVERPEAGASFARASRLTAMQLDAFTLVAGIGGTDVAFLQLTAARQNSGLILRSPPSILMAPTRE